VPHEPGTAAPPGMAGPAGAAGPARCGHYKVVSNATTKNCNVENLVARDHCITTILKNGSNTCL
jgi:hypothetical protein